jgi:hypothetical protein
MKKISSMIIAVVIVFAIGTAALAQEMMTKGMIKAIDAMANTMTIVTEDGKEVVFTVDEKCRVYCHVGRADKKLTDFSIGNKVTVIYRTVDMKNVALYIGRTAKM